MRCYDLGKHVDIFYSSNRCIVKHLGKSQKKQHIRFGTDSDNFVMLADDILPKGE